MNGIGIVVIFLMLAVYFFIFGVVIAGIWKTLTKAGEAGWKSLIPIYNIYIQFKIAWKTSAFWIYLLISAACGILNMGLSRLNAQENVSAPEGIIFTVLLIAFSIAEIVYTAKLYFRMAKSFGKSTGFGIGLLLFFPIFICVLGFDSGSRYIGAQTD